MAVNEFYIPQQSKSRYGGKDGNAGLGNKNLFTNVVSKDSGNVRYYSGIDAEIYFEETYVDEVVQFEFQVQQNVMPLFGYNSFVYDDVAVGSRIIQGRFAVNFTKAQYLYEIMNTLSQAPKAANAATTASDEATLSQYDVASIKGAASLTGDNLYGSQRKALWDRVFNMVISYGDAKRGGPDSTMLVLSGVVLTGCSQSFNMAGEPIMEMYSFIARDLQTVPVNSKGKDINITVESAPAVKTITQNDIIHITDLSYSEYLQDGNSTADITLEHDSLVDVNEITMLEPNLELDNKANKKASFVLGGVSNNIVYIVPDQLRKDINAYYKKTRNSFFYVDIIVKYTYNEVQASQTFRKRVFIKNILD